jgi:hypothetical protein
LPSEKATNEIISAKVNVNFFMTFVFITFNCFVY